MSKVKMDRPTSRRERKKQQTRQRLLECAWQQFLAKGYDETTVEDITEAADVAKGTFFNYFATKEVVLDELALWRLELLGNRMRAEDEATSGSSPAAAVERIKRLVCAIAGEFFPESDLPRHLFLARISAPIKHQSAHRLGSMMRELVEQAQQNSEIRTDIDADLITRLLMTSVFYHFMRAHPFPHHNHSPTANRSPLPETREEAQNDRVRYQQELENKLIESIEQLMDGLGGPDRRRR
jgi:AcrR family transcriptional regulator